MINSVNPDNLPIIASFIIVKNPMKLDKNEIISLLNTISYDDIEYQCIKCDNDSFLVGWSISGFNKLPGSDLATIDAINSVNEDIKDSSYFILTKTGKTVQRIYIKRSMA